MKTALVILVLLGVAVGGAAYYATHGSAAPVASFHATAIKRGDLFSTISATGTIQAEEVVNVGARGGRLDRGLRR